MGLRLSVIILRHFKPITTLATLQLPMNQTSSFPSESDFLEYPDSASTGFVLGMMITLTLLTIPILAIYLLRRLIIRKKVPIANG